MSSPSADVFGWVQRESSPPCLPPSEEIQLDASGSVSGGGREFGVGNPQMSCKSSVFVFPFRHVQTSCLSVSSLHILIKRIWFVYFNEPPQFYRRSNPLFPPLQPYYLACLDKQSQITHPSPFLAIICNSLESPLQVLTI